MSKLGDLKTKIHALGEIESILGAMKNLAIIEMSKVSKLMAAQTKASATIDAAVADFEYFYKNELLINPPKKKVLALLIGSERGFCGPFNEKVIESFQKATGPSKGERAGVTIVTIGRKLAMKFQNTADISIQLDGPNSADEISAVINDLATQLLLFADYRWLFVYNGENNVGGQCSVLFPLESRIQAKKMPFNRAPLLNMPAREVYPQLLEQHLFSVMHRALYASFMAENRERLHHMDGALNQIEKDKTLLTLELNGQRQEEITEELEILMLSSFGRI